MLGFLSGYGDDRHQRMIDRVQLKEYLRVYDQESHEILGYVLDISKTGVQLVSREPIDDLPEFNIKIELPITMDGINLISLTAQMIWRKTDAIPCYFDAGFAFCELNPHQEKALEKLIRDHALKKIEYMN